ncbi:MAG: hypothetical protein OHK0057_07270 [Thermoflexibacter sp.]
MKTIMTKAFMLIAVLMLGVATLSFANGASVEETAAGDFKYVTYVVKNKQQFVFAYATKSVQRVSLVIRDVEGNELHRDFFVEKEVGRVYDLSKYGNGTYILEVKTGDFYERKEIVINVEPSLVTSVNTLENKKVALTYKNTADSPVYIYINNVNGETVYEESSDLKKYNRVFDLANLPNGEYVILVTNNEKTIGQVVKIKK